MVSYKALNTTFKSVNAIAIRVRFAFWKLLYYNA